MAEKFKIGEIALLLADPADTPADVYAEFARCECVIDSEFAEQGPDWDFQWGIIIRVRNGVQLIAQPHELRKRSAPPITGEQKIRAMFDAPPVDQRRPATAWQAQYDTAQALMKMGVRVRPGKWPVEAEV